MVRLHANIGPFGISTNNLGLEAYLRLMYEGAVESVKLAARVADYSVRKAEEAAARRRLAQLEALIKFISSLRVAHQPDLEAASAAASVSDEPLVAVLRADTIPATVVDEDPTTPAILFRAPPADITPEKAPIGSSSRMRFEPISQYSRNNMYWALLGGLSLRVAINALSSGPPVEAAQVFAVRDRDRRMELLTVATLTRESVAATLEANSKYPGLRVHEHAQRFGGHIDEESEVRPVDMERQPGLAAVLQVGWVQIRKVPGTVGSINWS